MDHAAHASLEELRATLGKMEVALGVINDAIVWSDAAGDIRWCNAAFDRLVGKPHITLLGKSLTENLPLFEHGQRLPKKAHPVRTILERKMDVTGYYACEREGKRLFVEVTGKYLNMGSSSSAVLVIRDLTRERDLEQVRLQGAALRAAANAIVITDRDGRVRWANPAMEDLTGYSLEELYGQTLGLLRSGEHPEAFFEEMWKTILDGKVWEGEIVNRRKDGVLYTEQQTITPVPDDQGRIAHFIAVKQDITEKKRAREDLQKATAAAEAANRAKGEFLANMSHEIRTPMNAIIGMTELALDTGLTEEQTDYLATVRSSAESLLTIINDILDFSKIEAGRLVIESIPFELHTMLTPTLKALALRAQKKQLELVYTEEPGIPRFLMGDPERLKQVLINLVGNAIKFTDRGEVRITVSRKDAKDAGPSGTSPGNKGMTLGFTVADTGIGIASEKLGAIFEAFTQADSFTGRVYGGTGLGLTISKRLVELMGGSIHVTSLPGKGTSFLFTVPMEGVDDPPGGRLSEVPPAIQGTTLLGAVENASMRAFLQRLFSRWGLRATLFGSLGAFMSAVREIGAEAPSKGEGSLLLLDGSLLEKGEDQELGPLFTGDSPQRPLILLLGPGVRTRHLTLCRDAGVSLCLNKPVTPSDLLDALVRVLPGVPAGLPGREESAGKRPEPTRPLEILLAEDNPVNQKLAQRMLEKLGHRVVTVPDGRAVVTLAGSRAFDLILMDVQMPEMDGLSATVEIRRQEQGTGGHVPIVAMTANAMKGDRERCLEAGMDGYLSKPIRMQVLAETLANVARGDPAPLVSEPGQAPVNG